MHLLNVQNLFYSERTIRLHSKPVSHSKITTNTARFQAEQQSCAVLKELRVFFCRFYRVKEIKGFSSELGPEKSRLSRFSQARIHRRLSIRLGVEKAKRSEEKRRETSLARKIVPRVEWPAPDTAGIISAVLSSNAEAAIMENMEKTSQFTLRLVQALLSGRLVPFVWSASLLRKIKSDRQNGQIGDRSLGSPRRSQVLREGILLRG